jgi:DNA polymerase-3 subunit delta'
MNTWCKDDEKEGSFRGKDIRVMPNKPAFIPFSGILCQERAIEFLKCVISRGKIPHAYLFAGIPGIGKATTALALTGAVNCQQQIGGEGCTQCPSCRQIAGGNFPDLHMIEPDGQNIRIEQIRDLNRTLAFKPLSGKYRVSIIRQAETMTEEATNSLLKTLEEPPQNNILILNVTEPQALSPTIVSRCQKVLFRPIPVPAIADWLMVHQSLEKEEAAVLARISEGSLGRALRMCDEGFFKMREEYISDLIKLSDLNSEQILERALQYARKEKKGGADTGNGGADLFDLLSIWKSWYRDLLLVKLECPSHLLINVDFSRKLQKMSGHTNIDQLMESFSILDQSQRDLLQNRNLDLMMENTLLSLRRFA